MARPARKKKDIERAALELFVEFGIDGASIRMIAERAGVTEGALYRHHAGKDDLVRALFLQYFEHFAVLLEQAEKSQASIKAKFHAMIEGFYRFYDDDPKGFHFVLLVQHRLLDSVRRDMANPIAVISQVLRESIDKGEIPSQDVDLSAQMLMGMVTQAAVGHRYGRLKGKMRGYTDSVTAACMRVVQNGQAETPTG